MLRHRLVGIAALVLANTSLGGDPPLTPLRGRVIDDNQEGIAGARVRAVHLLGESDRNLGLERRVLATVRTGADGSFSLPVRARHREIWIEAQGATGNLAATNLLEFRDRGQQPLIILPSQGRRIEGVVRARDGTPIPNAAVQVGDGVFSFGELARTDVSGRFSIAGLPPGPLVIGTAPDGYAPKTVEADLGEESVAIELGRGKVLVGTVRERVNGRPVVGARVVSSEWPARVVLSDDKGRFRYRAYPSADGEIAGYIRVTSPGFERAFATPAEDAAEAANGEYRLDVELNPGAAVTATVVLEGGGTVSAADVEFMIGQRSFVRSTDDAGRFRIEHLAVTESFGPLRITVPGLFPTETRVIKLSRPRVHDLGKIELVRKPDRSVILAGKVTGMEGDTRRAAVLCWRTVRGGKAFVAQVSCDSSGDFRAEVPPDSVLLVQARIGGKRSAARCVIVESEDVVLDTVLRTR